MSKMWAKLVNCCRTLMSKLKTNMDIRLMTLASHCFTCNCVSKGSNLREANVEGTSPLLVLGATSLSKVSSSMLTVCPHSGQGHRNSKLALASQQDSFYVDKDSCQIAGEVRI